MLLKNIIHKGRFLFTPCTIIHLFGPLMNVFGLKGKICPVQTDSKGVQQLPILLLGPAHHLTKQWVMSM